MRRLEYCLAYRSDIDAYNDGVTLAGKEFQLINDERLRGDTICLNDGEVVVVDGNGEDVAGRLVDETKTVTLSGSYMGNSEWDRWATVKAARSIDSTAVRDTLK